MRSAAEHLMFLAHWLSVGECQTQHPTSFWSGFLIWITSLFGRTESQSNSCLPRRHTPKQCPHRRGKEGI